MIQLRDYQQSVDSGICAAWAGGNDNVLAVLPTGAGKTVLFSNRIASHNGAAVAIAHRQELVGQISCSLASFGVRHRIIGPDAVRKWVTRRHLQLFGARFIDQNAQVGVAGVNTLTSRAGKLAPWLRQISLWVQDEAHHIAASNQWYKATQLMPNAKGLGVTATPLRADGKGLGRHADGVFDTIVRGPEMRELINAGYLSDYDAAALPSDIDVSTVAKSADGDYNRVQLKAASQGSHIVGDIVKHYLKWASGKLGVTFVTDVETAGEVAKQYRAAGVPAEVVTAKTPAHVRVAIQERFTKREILQLVNVDLFGEGYDSPALEVVSMARPTESYGLYCQQFGRALRPIYRDGADLSTRAGRLEAIANGPKPKALIIDHVGNVARHGLPDRVREWSLDRREKRSASKDPDDIPTKICTKCGMYYEAFRIVCPVCGFVQIPAVRSAPEMVEGDLQLLDAATLEAMRGEISRIDRPAAEVRAMMERAGHSAKIAGGASKQHMKRQTAQMGLRESLRWWFGHQRALGRPDAEIQRRFYHGFGLDLMTAQTLGRPEAEELTARVQRHTLKLVGQRGTL